MSKSNPLRFVPELRRGQPYSAFPLLRKQTLHPGDPKRGIFPVRLMTFAYAEGKSLQLQHATEVLKVVHGVTGRAKSYSPTSDDARKGEFDLIIKVYPGEGNSAYLDSVQVGDPVQMTGPLPPPQMRPIYQPGKRVIALALGIGITHAFTTVREELERNTGSRVTLVVAVQYADQDVVLSKETQDLEREHSDRFDVVRCATKESVPGWRHGRADCAMIKELMGDYKPDDVRVVVVGTKDMKRAVWKDLGDLGMSYVEHSLVKKQSGVL